MRNEKEDEMKARQKRSAIDRLQVIERTCSGLTAVDG